MKPILTIILPVLLFQSVLLFAGQPEDLFEKANTLYAEGNYREALTLYDSISNQGFIAQQLYFNMGNCHFKLNHIGPAILNYERALKLKPGDRDIRHNLLITESKVVTKVEKVPELVFEKWWRQIIHLNTASGWARWSLTSIWLALIGAAFFLFSNLLLIRKIGFYGALLFFLLAVVGLLGGWQNYKMTNQLEQAIVMATNAYVKSAPDSQSTDLFILHEGVKASVLDMVGEWSKIQLADGNEGWIPAYVLEKI